MKQTYSMSMEKTQEFGVVSQVRFPLVFVEGLPGIRLSEMVVFETGDAGYVIGMDTNVVRIAMLSTNSVRPGTHLTRTGEVLHIPVGEAQAGMFLNSLAEPLLPDESPSETNEWRPIDIPPPPIEQRDAISRQLITGSTLVDLMIPLAIGQREAVIGEQKAGKTSFLLGVAMGHAARGGIVVYAAIGRPWNEVKRIANFIDGQMKRENVILVAAGADETPSLITLTPYTAMTIAEYWRDKGRDVLLVLHDLSTHARFYREVALLAEQFPGRESYPGDIFYAHARLLERGGAFTHPDKGQSSISVLVVGEMIQSDVTSYIISNLISITDGHLLFDSTKFREGQRPPIDVAGSVTRIGIKVASQLFKKLYLELLPLFAKYEDAKRYSHFDTELTGDLSRTLLVVTHLYTLFSQPSFLAIPETVQVIMTGIIWQGWLNEMTDDKDVAAVWRDRLVKIYTEDPTAMKRLDAMAACTSLNNFIGHLNTERAWIKDLCEEPIQFATS